MYVYLYSRSDLHSTESLLHQCYGDWEAAAFTVVVVGSFMHLLVGAWYLSASIFGCNKFARKKINEL